jgi:uncharacterized protein YkwD
MPKGRLSLGILASVVGLAAAGAAPSAATPARVAAPASLAALNSNVVQQLNAIRREHGLVAVKVNQDLADAAASHSDEMAADGYFNHASFDGTAFWKRIVRWYGQDGYTFWSVGENLLWSSPEADAAKALRMWMASPPHRANILKAAWREVGVSAVHVDEGPGIYGGQPTTIITLDFGVRR